jgi:tetratricopeptide (TPR) repeat protein
MVLQGLEAAHLQQIAERMAGAPIVVTGDAGEIGDFLHRAEGNPYYVISTLQVLSDRGRLKMQESKAMVDFSGDEEDGERLSLPRTIRHAVRERLSMFPEPETEFLVASAVLGQEFSLDIVAAALGWPRQEAERAASTLENARVLRRCPGPDQGLRSFANSVTWEAAYSLAPPGKHMVFARSLAKWYVRNAPESLETIARLYHDAGEADEGLPWVRKAMELALRSGTPEMVARLHSWLQEFLSKSGTPPDERVREGLEIVDRLDDLHGESWTLPSILEKLRKLHPSPALAQLVGFRLVRALTSLDLDRAQTNLDLLLSSSVTPAEAGSKDAIVSLIMAKSSLMIHKGNYAGVVEEARKGLPHLEHDGASRDHIHLLYMMQISLAAMGNLEAAAELNREFKPLTENSDCGFFRYLGMVQEAFLANVSGDFARAGELYGKGAMLANAIGRTFNEVSCLYNSGITAVSIGDAPTANSMLGKASRVARRFGHTEWMGCLIYLEGEILLCEQKWAQAASHIRHAIQGGAKSNLGEELPHAQLALAEALFHSGDIDGSRKWLKEVASGSNKTQFESLPRFYRVSAQVEEFGGNVEGARELLHSSIETAAKVGNYLERGKSRWELAEVEGKHGGQTGGEALRAEATADFDRCHLPERFRPAHPHDPTS